MKFQSRAPVYCNICNKELKHKHRPKKEWNIEGFLCGECHMDKMREFFEGTMPQNCVKCSIKKKKISLQKKNFAVCVELN